jgi:hypothetical protein
MREVAAEEADRLTLFMYEEILAFRQAAENAGLSKSDLEDVFYNNSSVLIEAVRKGK